MAKKYEVEVDGEVEEVSTKTEAKKVVLEALADGEEHVVTVEEIDEKALAEAAAEEKAAAEAAAQVTEIKHYL